MNKLNKLTFIDNVKLIIRKVIVKFIYRIKNKIETKKMRFIRATIILIICIIIFSIFIANVTNLINIDYSLKTSDNDNIDVEINKIDKNLQLTDSTDHLMWFLQVNIVLCCALQLC